MLNSETDYVQAAIDAGVYAKKPKKLEPARNEPPAYFGEDPFYANLSNSKPQQKREPEKNRFSFIGGNDLFTVKPIDWLIKGIIERDTLVSIFGQSGSGKSFVAIDLSLSIATGTEWAGNTVKQGKVVYVAGEGKAGIKRRIAAWAQVNGHHSEIAENFLLSNITCSLPDDVWEFIKALKEIPDLRLLVLDTLQRTYTGDENSTRDMTAYIRAVDTIRTEIPGLVVMLVHHTGHGDDSRARGSSALYASLDAEIKVKKSERSVSVSCTKAKEGEEFSEIGFILKSETLINCEDEDGNSVTSAVLELSTDYSPAQKSVSAVKPQTGLKLQALTILDTLQNHSKANVTDDGRDASEARVLFDEWVETCVRNGISDKTSRFTKRISDQLLTSGVIKREGHYVVRA